MREFAWLLAALVALAGCRSEPRLETTAPSDSHFVLAGATVVGIGRADIEVEDGRIVAVGGVSSSGRRIELGGRFVVPAFIDSHVHLAYLPRAQELLQGGIAAAVDLASPLSFLAADTQPLRVIRSGPMITAFGGYPTESWGRDGYGYEVDGESSALSAVDELYSRGARVVKIPLSDEPALDDVELEAAVSRGHARGMKVVVHALTDAEALRAARANADVLAHTPVEPLSTETLEAWRGRALVSTLSAFGGSVARENLAALRKSNVAVLYGTDFGNTRELGISLPEIEELIAAGVDVIAAGTRVPAEFWGFGELGAIAPGKRASLLVLDADPLVDPRVLAQPAAVYIDGVVR